jgi:Rad3-related DNA helicase
VTNAWAADWDEAIPAESEYIDATFGHGGYLARRWGESYQPREGQIMLARAVDRAIVNRTHLLSEAPTGTGKSIAYSVPATYHAAMHGKIVVIVTANIALQEQLVQKDLPLLSAILPWGFSYGLLKGRSNYLCRAEYERVHLDKPQQSMFDAGVMTSPQDRDRLRLLQWAEAEVAAGGYGDQSTIGWKPSDKLWRELSVGPEDCRGSRCAFASQCGALAAQKLARESKVVVTNYHIFFTNLLIYLDKGLDVVLPPFDVAIFDECFPAGTLLGDIPIESIRVGDLVDSYCQKTGAFVRRRVTKRFVRQAGRLVRLTIGGRSLVCTPGHPILTARGWVTADSIRVGDGVLDGKRNRDGLQDLRSRGSRFCDHDGPHEESRASLLLAGTHAAGKVPPARDCSTGCRDGLRDLRQGGARVGDGNVSREDSWPSVLLTGARSGVGGSADQRDEADRSRFALHDLRQGGARVWQGDERCEAARESVLLAGTQAAMAGSANDRSWPRSRCSQCDHILGAYETEQSNARSVRPGEAVGDVAIDGVGTAETGRERPGADCSATVVGERFGVAVRSRDRHRSGWSAQKLQTGHWQSGPEDCDRNRRLVPQFATGSSSGSAEGGVATWTRVDGVEVLERGCDGTFGGVCPDGLVYNLEVEETNTYLANGFVVHNCHRAADVARDFFGWKLAEGSIKRACSFLRTLDPPLVEATVRAGSWFFSQMKALRYDRDRYKARVVPDKLSRDDVAAAQGLLDQLGQVRARIAQECVGLEALGARDQLAAAELAQDKVQRLLGSVSSVLEGGGDNEVIFLEEDEFRKVSVVCRLVRPAQVLREGLFGKTVLRDGPADGDEPTVLPVSVIGTSATVTTESSFRFAQEELGVTDCETLVVDSPFDFERQALLIIPDGICEPNDLRFTEEVAALFLRTIELARGRTLGLFTSRKRMNEVFDAVIGRTPFRILRQDDGQRTAIVEEFRRDRHSVLLGVASFWAGVDVPGDSLSCVFIDKLPFPPPDDPVLDRLSETDKRAWAAYAVPRAIIEFKQGFGRLIRSTTDHGVVVCCDGRLITKGYGKQFLRAMPKAMQKIRNLDAIREWLDGPISAPEEVVDPLS